VARVMLVEDDPAIASLYALQPCLDGHDVQVLASSTAAAEPFRRERPQVVCIDLRP
jgi:DNA-binding response OmpR family regulator